MIRQNNAKIERHKRREKPFIKLNQIAINNIKQGFLQIKIA